MRRGLTCAAALAGVAAAVIPLTVTPAAATPWGRARPASRGAPWGTNPRHQPAPRPWYHTVFSDEFKTQADVYAWQSPPDVNDAVSLADSLNAALQKPTLASDVTVVRAGHDSTALQVATQAGTYQTTAGEVYGMTNGRVDIGPDFALAQHVISMRLRAVGQPGKASAMVWPQTGWPWEFDMAEWFPDRYGSTAYSHMELTPGQTVHDFLPATRIVNPYAWHTYALEFLGGPVITGVRYLIDGTPLTFDEDGTWTTVLTGRWIPTSGIGHVAIGKALPGPRDTVPLTHVDAVQVDWVRIQAH